MTMKTFRPKIEIWHEALVYLEVLGVFLVDVKQRQYILKLGSSLIKQGYILELRSQAFP